MANNNELMDDIDPDEYDPEMDPAMDIVGKTIVVSRLSNAAHVYEWKEKEVEEVEEMPVVVIPKPVPVMGPPKLLSQLSNKAGFDRSLAAAAAFKNKQITRGSSILDLDTTDTPAERSDRKSKAVSRRGSFNSKQMENLINTASNNNNNNIAGVSVTVSGGSNSERVMVPTIALPLLHKASDSVSGPTSIGPPIPLSSRGTRSSAISRKSSPSSSFRPDPLVVRQASMLHSTEETLFDHDETEDSTDQESGLMGSLRRTSDPPAAAPAVAPAMPPVMEHSNESAEDDTHTTTAIKTFAETLQKNCTPHGSFVRVHPAAEKDKDQKHQTHQTHQKPVMSASVGVGGPLSPPTERSSASGSSAAGSGAATVANSGASTAQKGGRKRVKSGGNPATTNSNDNSNASAATTATAAAAAAVPSGSQNGAALLHKTLVPATLTSEQQLHASQTLSPIKGHVKGGNQGQGYSKHGGSSRANRNTRIVEAAAAELLGDIHMNSTPQRRALGPLRGQQGGGGGHGSRAILHNSPVRQLRRPAPISAGLHSNSTTTTTLNDGSSSNSSNIVDDDNYSYDSGFGTGRDSNNSKTTTTTKVFSSKWMAIKYAKEQAKAAEEAEKVDRERREKELRRAQKHEELLAKEARHLERVAAEKEKKAQEQRLKRAKEEEARLKEEARVAAEEQEEIQLIEQERALLFAVCRTTRERELNGIALAKIKAEKIARKHRKEAELQAPVQEGPAPMTKRQQANMVKFEKKKRQALHRQGKGIKKTSGGLPAYLLRGPDYFLGGANANASASTGVGTGVGKTVTAHPSKAASAVLDAEYEYDDDNANEEEAQAQAQAEAETHEYDNEEFEDEGGGGGDGAEPLRDRNGGRGQGPSDSTGAGGGGVGGHAAVRKQAQAQAQAPRTVVKTIRIGGAEYSYTETVPVAVAGGPIPSVAAGSGEQQPRPQQQQLGRTAKKTLSGSTNISPEKKPPPQQQQQQQQQTPAAPVAFRGTSSNSSKPLPSIPRNNNTGSTASNSIKTSSNTTSTNAVPVPVAVPVMGPVLAPDFVRRQRHSFSSGTSTLGSIEEATKSHQDLKNVMLSTATSEAGSDSGSGLVSHANTAAASKAASTTSSAGASYVVLPVPKPTTTSSSSTATTTATATHYVSSGKDDQENGKEKEKEKDDAVVSSTANNSVDDNDVPTPPSPAPVVDPKSSPVPTYTHSQTHIPVSKPVHASSSSINSSSNSTNSTTTTTSASQMLMNNKLSIIEDAKKAYLAEMRQLEEEQMIKASLSGERVPGGSGSGGPTITNLGSSSGNVVGSGGSGPGSGKSSTDATPTVVVSPLSPATPSVINTSSSSSKEVVLTTAPSSVAKQAADKTKLSIIEDAKKAYMDEMKKMEEEQLQLAMGRRIYVATDDASVSNDSAGGLSTGGGGGGGPESGKPNYSSVKVSPANPNSDSNASSYAPMPRALPPRDTPPPRSTAPPLTTGPIEIPSVSPVLKIHKLTQQSLSLHEKTSNSLSPIVSQTVSHNGGTNSEVVSQVDSGASKTYSNFTSNSQSPYASTIHSTLSSKVQTPVGERADGIGDFSDPPSLVMGPTKRVTYEIGDIVSCSHGLIEGMITDKVGTSKVKIDTGKHEAITIDVSELCLLVGAHQFEVGDKVRVRPQNMFTFFLGHIVSVNPPGGEFTEETYDVAMVDDPDDIEENAPSKNLEKIMSRRLLKNKAKRTFKTPSSNPSPVKGGGSRKGSFTKPSRKPSFDINPLNRSESEEGYEQGNDNDNDVVLNRSESFSTVSGSTKTTGRGEDVGSAMDKVRRKFSVGDVVMNKRGQKCMVVEKKAKPMALSADGSSSTQIETENLYMLDAGTKDLVLADADELDLIVGANDYEIGDKVQARAAATFNYFTGHIIAIHEPTDERKNYIYDVQMIDDADDIQYDTLKENMRKLLSNRLIKKKVRKLVSVVRSVMAFGLGKKGKDGSVSGNGSGSGKDISAGSVVNAPDTIPEEVPSSNGDSPSPTPNGSAPQSHVGTKTSTPLASASNTKASTPLTSNAGTKRNSVNTVPQLNLADAHIGDSPSVSTTEHDDDDKFDHEFCGYRGVPEIQYKIPQSVKSSRQASRRASPRGSLDSML